MRFFKRKMIAVLLALALISLTMPVQAASGGPFGTALSWTGNTGKTMSVTWRDELQRDELLQLVSQRQYADNGFTGAAEFSAQCEDISPDGSGAWHYEASADDLSAGTAYVYRVGCDGSWSAARTFTTADPEADGVSFFYMGDIQPEDHYAEGFAQWGQLAQDAYRRDPEAAFGILGGDIVDNGISVEQFDLFRESAEPVFSQIPLMATNGNHESNFPDSGKPELYLKVFALPRNGPAGFPEEFYSFDYANCHILVLNSWIYSGEQNLTDAQIAAVNDWIRADLAASTADWQIVVTHVPVYPVHSDTTAEKEKANWAPIFEKYGVDLVLEGHQQVYTRSEPMYEGKIDYAKGITYIMGNAGQKFYDSADETFAARTVYGVSNYQLIQADGDSLTVRSADSAGNELDYDCVLQRSILATRGEYLETLWKAAGSPAAAAGQVFRDVPEGDARAQAVAWAKSTGLVRGYGGGDFGPDDPVTKAQIGLILDRLADMN